MAKISSSLFFIFCFSFFILPKATAGFFSDSAGVNGDKFLVIPLNARIVSMGESGVAVSGTDFCEYNPASICGQEPVFQFSHLNYFEGLTLSQFRFFFRFETLDYSGNKAMVHFVGFSVKNFSASDEERDGITGAVGGSFGVKNQSFEGIYATRLNKVYFGIGIKSVTEKISNFSSDGFLVDSGVVVPLGKIVNLGCSMRNLGKSFDSGKSPLALRVGLSAIFSSFLAVADLEKISSEKTSLSTGLEYRFDLFSFRVGCGYRDFLLPAAGFGIVFKNIIFDYAYSYHKYLGENHYFTVSLGF